MGVLVTPNMTFALNQIMQQYNLEELVTPFTEQEINAVQ
jgi:hypothetical protein